MGLRTTDHLKENAEGRMKNEELAVWRTRPGRAAAGENRPNEFALCAPQPGRDAFHLVPNFRPVRGRGRTRPYHPEGVQRQVIAVGLRLRLTRQEGAD